MVDRVKTQGTLSKSSSDGRAKAESLDKKKSPPIKQTQGETQVQSAVAGEKARESRLSKVLDGLDDAVKFSNFAVKSLNKITEDEGASAEPEVTNDLGRLREDIEGVLVELRRRADTADVMRANFDASDAKLPDFDINQAAARESLEKVTAANVDEIVNAHGGLGTLTFERVMQLLEE